MYVFFRKKTNRLFASNYAIGFIILDSHYIDYIHTLFLSLFHLELNYPFLEISWSSVSHGQASRLLDSERFAPLPGGLVCSRLRTLEGCQWVEKEGIFDINNQQWSTTVPVWLPQQRHRSRPTKRSKLSTLLFFFFPFAILLRNPSFALNPSVALIGSAKLLPLCFLNNSPQPFPFPGCLVQPSGQGIETAQSWQILPAAFFMLQEYRVVRILIIQICDLSFIYYLKNCQYLSKILFL